MLEPLAKLNIQWSLKPNMPTYKLKQYLVPFLLFSIAIHIIPLKAQQVPAAQVVVHEVKTMSLTPTIKVQGDVVSLNNAKISSQVEGEVTRVILPATRLEKGDVIATIDPKLMELEVIRNQANLKRLKADLEFQKQELKRFERLAETENASKAALQKALSVQQMLMQDIIKANADLQRAEYALSHATIKAPFSGLFISRDVSVGEYIQVGKVIGKLISTEEKEIVTAAPIKIVQFLNPENEVNVIDGNTVYSLPIRTFTTVGDMTSRMINVHIKASEPELLIGSSVIIELPSANMFSGAVLPRDALVNRSQGSIVYKVNDDMTVTAVPAQVTHAIGQWIALSSGVTVGDTIVIRGAERLTPGQKVTISDK